MKQLFSVAGEIGVWTKADSHTRFDDLTAAPLTHDAYPTHCPNDRDLPVLADRGASTIRHLLRHANLDDASELERPDA